MEIWKDIKGFEGYYQVSSFGNVRSVERTVTFKNGVVCKYKGKQESQTAQYPNVLAAVD